MPLRQKLQLGIVGALLLTNFFIYYAVVHEDRHGLLTVAFLDIGQGDAIFIESPTGNQIVVDGGPDTKVLSELGKVMPFYDRTIDMLVVTNPDKDHFAGFIDVLNNYHVGEVLEPGTDSPSETYKELEATIVRNHVPRMIGRRGTAVDLGGGARLEILFPNYDVDGWKTNDGSIVARLTYGSTSVMLMGDAPAKIEHYLVGIDGAKLKSTILKAGHHGSRTSSSEEFVAAVAPEEVVISDGKNNKYGHPHKETLDTFNKFHIPVLRTDLRSTIIMKSDGAVFTLVQ